MADGQWHHIAVTLDREQPSYGGKFYVDGVLIGGLISTYTSSLSTPARSG